MYYYRIMSAQIKHEFRYFIYCRKSTEDEEKQQLSIPAQVTEIKQFAEQNNYRVVDILTETKTAKIPGRKIFNQMLKQIEAGEAQGILAWHPFMSIPQFFYIRPVSIPVFLRA